jgi:membrane protein YdbS with pleckstrin-like domain
VPTKASFCPQCGTQLASAPRIGPRKRKKRLPGGPAVELASDQVIWEGSYSKLAMLGSWITAAVLTLAAVVVAAVLELPGQGGWLGLVGLVLAVWLGVLGRYFYLRLSCHYALSAQRFTHKSGLLWRTIDRIEVIDIDDVSFYQGPVERLLGVGTIEVASSDQTHPQLTLPGIEQVQQVATLIDNARREERRRRGLYIESV